MVYVCVCTRVFQQTLIGCIDGRFPWGGVQGGIFVSYMSENK